MICLQNKVKLKRQLKVFLIRFLPMLMPKSGDGKATGPDLSTLRTFRVLRPLKLVSGVPSKEISMEEPGEQCIVVFVKEPASECVCVC